MGLMVVVILAWFDNLDLQVFTFNHRHTTHIKNSNNPTLQVLWNVDMLNQGKAAL